MALDLEKPICENNEDNTRTVIPIVNQQVTTAYKHYVTEDPHIFLMDAYTGGGGFLGQAYSDIHNLNPKCYVHPKPTENFYQDRVRFTQYFNLMKKFIQSLVKPVFASGVTYVSEDEKLNDFISYANVGGISLDEVKKQAGFCSVLQDVSYLIMDKNPEEEKPRLSYRRTDEVQDYGRSKRDKSLVWIAFYDGCDENGNQERLLYEIGKVSRQVQNNRSTGEWKTVEEASTGIDELNVYPMFYTYSSIGDYRPVMPSMLDIGYYLANIYNDYADADYLKKKQGYGILVAITEKINGLLDPLSNMAVIQPSSDMQSDIKYITPDPEMLTKHVEYIESKLRNLSNLMGDKGVDIVDKSDQSGVSKGYDYVATNDALLSTVKMYEQADKWIFRLYKKIMGSTFDLDIEVVYPQEFFPMPAIELDMLLEVEKRFAERGLVENSREALTKIALVISDGDSLERQQELVEEIRNSDTIQMEVLD